MAANLCFNTQPPEGGWRRHRLPRPHQRRFNTQPPEGGWILITQHPRLIDGFNTQPPEGGWMSGLARFSDVVSFQHTAARRRLAG